MGAVFSTPNLRLVISASHTLTRTPWAGKDIFDFCCLLQDRREEAAVAGGVCHQQEEVAAEDLLHHKHPAAERVVGFSTQAGSYRRGLWGKNCWRPVWRRGTGEDSVQGQSDGNSPGQMAPSY